MEGGGGLNYVPRYFQERSRFSLLTQTGANRLPQLQSGVDHPGPPNQTIFKYDGKRRRRRRGHGTISEFKASFQPLIYCAIPRTRWLRSRQHLGDTVSTILKISGVHAHRLMGERFGLRSGGDEQKLMTISR